ncbi:MAG TPA: sulfotransferase, partial [Thermoanaerobaculia bacterium]|nr:sulfotransferase [Thermoanaerobaculia bacterium]
MLRNLLRSHPDLFLPSESHFIPPFCRAWGDPGDDREARRLGRRILRLHWVRWWGVELGAREFDGCRSFAEVVDRIYGELARREGARRWGDKTPGYALHIATLAEIFPAAQFVHIVRDGRDVALSLVRTGFGP